MDEFFDANRRNWDDRVAIHRRDATGFYAVEKVLRGGDKLNAIEAAEIGDISGLRVIHLQCHFGLGTICLARRGAKVTGLDFSPAAIAEARELARKTGSDVRFVEGNVYAARQLLEGEFDMAYVTWGTINWLPDLKPWGTTIASLLKPGGFLYLAESHPAALCLEWVDDRLTPRYDWRTARDRPLVWDDAKTYNGDATPLANPRCYEWIHPLHDIFSALRGPGLAIDWLHEHDALTWPLFPNMVEGSDGLYRLPTDHPQLPLAFSLRAVKPPG
jgi:SAM-dependent methyltransferase